MTSRNLHRNILAVDLCRHLLSVFEKIPAVRLTSITSRNHIESAVGSHSINLIIIGISRFPIRRLFINRIRRFFPEAPMLILRRENSGAFAGDGQLRGEFLLSDRGQESDLELVKSVRDILPLTPCEHFHRNYYYDLVREVLRILSEEYADPELNLNKVAKKLLISPAKLSRILNQQVGVSFRQLLRQVRIEEAKLMLATRNYSIKEVAARVGFSDSHYFSRSFKEVTGLSATEYQYSAQDVVLN